MRASINFDWIERPASNASTSADLPAAACTSAALRATDIDTQSASYSSGAVSPSHGTVPHPPVPCSPGAVSATALWAAGTRCLASRRCPGEFAKCDSYAEAFAGDEGLALAEAYDHEKRRSFAQQGRSMDGASMYYVASRSQTIDELVMQTLCAPDAPRRGVLLGAGLDSRAWRLEFPPDFTWYELDASKDFVEKAKLTDDQPRCVQVCAQVDFSATDWALKALPAGLSHTPTLWVAEGLAYYLTPSQLDGLVSTLTDLSAPGSTFIFDAHDLKDAPQHKGAVALTAFADFWRCRGVSYQSSCEHIERPLTQAGWDIATSPRGPYAVKIKVATLNMQEPRLRLAVKL